MNKKPTPKYWLKDHELAALVNEITKAAVTYHDHQSLRQRMSQILITALKGKKHDKETVSKSD